MCQTSVIDRTTVIQSQTGLDDMGKTPKENDDAVPEAHSPPRMSGTHLGAQTCGVVRHASATDPPAGSSPLSVSAPWLEGA